MTNEELLSALDLHPDPIAKVAATALRHSREELGRVTKVAEQRLKAKLDLDDDLATAREELRAAGEDTARMDYMIAWLGEEQQEGLTSRQQIDAARAASSASEAKP